MLLVMPEQWRYLVTNWERGDILSLIQALYEIGTPVDKIATDLNLDLELIFMEDNYGRKHFVGGNISAEEDC